MTFALELKDVRHAFGKTEILRGVSLQVRQGERCAVIGPNGAGKSTLFHLISGRHAASGGDVLLKGESIAGLSPFQIHRRGLTRSFQVTNVFPLLSVEDNLRCAVLWPLGHRLAFWRRLNRLADVRERVDAMLDAVGLTHRRHVQAGVLAYAEQRALEIGITVAGGADVILLDEPTAGMSRAESEAAVILIRKLTEGKTLLMVEHDMHVVFGLADRVAVLVQGELLAFDTPERIRADVRVQQAYLGRGAT